MPSRLPRVRPSVNLTEQVHDALMTAIVEGTLIPGERYSVQSLAERFGVSRTPVREAMLQLARRGLVSIVRNQGVEIIERSLQDLEDIFQIRLWLEVPAAREAARKADDDDKLRVRAHYDKMRAYARAGRRVELEREDRLLHLAVLEVSGNLRLARLVDELRDFVISHGRTTTGRSRSLTEIAEEHGDLVEAIERNDADGAAAAMASHIEKTGRALVAQESAPAPRPADGDPAAGPV